MQHVLITGGAGYIGSVMVPLLLKEGFFVTVLDSLLYSPTSLLPCFESPNFRFVKGDAQNEPLIASLMKEADVIIPLAALVGAPICAASPSVAKLVNYDAVLLILRYLKQEQKVIFPNSNSGYGIGQKEIFCTEKTPLNPVSLYGKLKVDAEKELLQTKRAVSLRLATVFGISPRMRLDLLVNDFTFRACHEKVLVLFEEHFKRNYIHVKDVAKAFLFAICNFDKMKGEAFNVGLSSANLSKKELAQTIRKYVPDLYIHAAEIGKDPDQRNYIVSNEKLESLGWKSTKTLEEGIQEIISAYPLLKKSEFKNV